MKGGKREGIEEPATDGVTDDPMSKGNGAGARPYVLYHERCGHDPKRRRSTTTIDRVVWKFFPERDIAPSRSHNVAGNDWNTSALVEQIIR